MSAREQLRIYLQQLEQRLRLWATLRGAAVLVGSALVATLLLVAVANRFAFSGGSVGGARLVLAAVLCAAVALGIVLPLRRLGRREAVARAEAAFPEFDQRLTTFADRDGKDPFIELLAADTLEFTPSAPPHRLAPDNWIYSSIGAGVGCMGVLIWMIAAGPGYWGYGASLIWTGPRTHAAPLYSLKVTPGNAVVRRHGDELITAVPKGWAQPDVRLFARFQSASKWEEAPMRPQMGAPGPGAAAGGYQYLFAGLPEDVDYYVESGALRSPTYHLRVRDLPAVKQIGVTYHYPVWTGIKDTTNAHAGDLRAVAGTVAQLEVTTDQPLSGGELAIDTGGGTLQQVPLIEDGANRYRGQFTLQKDGVYHVAAVVPGEDPTLPTRLSEDYFIAAPPAAPPQVALVRPGRDYRASPIEEVTVAAKASDEFGLKDFALHYSINGGPEKTVALLSQPGAKSADGSTVISFESFKAQPGDLVSVYASAKDGAATARTDITFIQADPFERDFEQSQQSGGGGGGGGGAGNTAAQITDREKEIIAGTFRQQNDTSGSAQLASDTAKLLSQSQTALRAQAISFSGRMESRELTEENAAFSEFQQDMIAAAQAMQPAADSLQGEKWSAAIPNEEKALRSLLRAESTFRNILVAFGARGGGGGGGGGSAARDLASLFDLELDTQKNQYETQPTASSQEQRSQSIDDTLQKLDQLAQRQQQLSQPNAAAQSAEERWQQDLLRREAEELQKQLQQLAQNNQGSQSGQQGQSGQSSSSASSSSSSSSSSSGAASGQASSSAQSQAQAQAQAAQQALQRLQQANAAMQRAASQNESAQQRAADSQAAANFLRQARQALAGLQQDNATGRLAGMANEADQLAQQQKQQADDVRKIIASQQNASQQTIDGLIQGRQQVSDQFDQLQKEMRNAARDLNTAQPGAANQIRSALDGLDANDLGTRLQRSSDWLRNGSFSDNSETSITHDLQQLGQQLRQAQQSLSGAQQANSNGAIADAMNQLERLRQQLAGDGNPNGQAGQQGTDARLTGQQGPAGQQYQAGQLSRNGQNGQQGGQQSGQQGGQRNGQNGQQSAQNGGSRSQNGAGNGGGRNGANNSGIRNGGNNAGGNRNGDLVGNRVAGNTGAVRNGYNDGQVGNAAGGGYRDRYGNGGYDLGNTHIVGQAVAPQAGPNPDDTQRQINQDLDALNRIRQALPNDAEAQRQIQALIQETRNLDPSRFPGNPEMVAEMHQELLTSVDTLELQLRRQLDTSQGGQIRGQAPQPAPAGYADAVAEYYRQLSHTTASSSGGGH